MRFKNIAPIVLTAISVASSIAAVVMAAHETPRAIEILDNHRLDVDPDMFCDADPLSVKDKALDYAKGYWKTGVLLGISVSSSIASCVIGHRNYRALAAATATLYAAYSKHKGKVKEFIGEEKAKLIDQAVKRELIEQRETEDLNEKVWFQDAVTEEFFQMTWQEYYECVIYAMTVLGDQNEDGNISLGDVFPKLKKIAPIGSRAIWSRDYNLERSNSELVTFDLDKRNSRCSEDDSPIDIRFNEGRETWVINPSVWPIPYNVAVSGGFLSPTE